MIDLYKILYNLPRSALYCFINKEDKRIYITWSIDLLAGVTRHISDLQGNIHKYRNMQLDCNKLEFSIIETIIDDKDDIAIKYTYWVDYYKNLGYSLYSVNQVVRYKIRSEIRDDGVVYVYLIDRAYKKTILGLFDNMPDATSFISLIENNFQFPVPIYAINDLTKNYYKNLP